MLRRLVLFVTLLLPLPAPAANWEFVSDDNYGEKHYIDRDSETLLSGGHRRIWEKDTKEDSKRLSLFEFSCTGQYRVLEFYRSDGSKDTDLTGKWEYVRPDSIVQMEEKAVCKK